MRVAITGASGNVGTALLRRLEREPAIDEIVGVARRVDPPPPQHPKVRWQAADVRDRAGIDAAFAGADAVVHLAWAIQPSRDRALTRSINVLGSDVVFRAAAAAGARTLVYASSVGVYGPARDDAPVDESYPVTGLPTSFYSVDKADSERRLDALGEPDGLRVVRLRPGLIFQRSAAQEIRRLFAGPFLPTALLRPGVLPVLPRVSGVRFQAIHADDVADAYHAALMRGDAHGAFNIATDDVLDLGAVADVLHARAVPVPFTPVRLAAAAAWRARAIPTPPGWLDLAAQAPLLDASRARRELGWSPSRTGHEALTELLEGMVDHAGGDTVPLEPDAGGPLRLRELASGLGARLGGKTSAG